MVTAGGSMSTPASIIWRAAADNSARLAIRLDSALMAALGVTADAIVRVATDRGRSMLVRLDPPIDADRGTGIVRLDRFVRQALKAHLNESVDIEPANVGPVARVELNPAVDVSMAHDLVPHIKAGFVRGTHAGQHRRGALCPLPQVACRNHLRGPAGVRRSRLCR